MTEEQLPIAGEDERAFADFHARLFGKFRRFASVELRDPETADDIVQSTMAAVWQRYFCVPQVPYVHVDALAFRMLKLRISNANREHDRRLARQGGVSRPASSDDHSSHGASLTREDVLKAALGEMTPRSREIFLLRREAGMTFREIASVTDTDAETASALLHRAHHAVYQYFSRTTFVPSVHRRNAEPGGAKWVPFVRDPENFESQEALIERKGNPNSALLSDYLAGELPPQQMADVARRLEGDPEFRELAEPLLVAWSVPTKSKPATPAEVEQSWLRVRERLGLPPIDPAS